MYAQVEKSKENKSRSVANSVTQKKNNVNLRFGFVDNRHEALRATRFTSMVNNYSVQQQQPIQKKNNTELIDNQNIQMVSGRDEFKAGAKEKLLNRNKEKHDGFYTCEICGFQNRNITYATLNGGKIGDGCFHIDHKSPASKGGRALMRNAAVLCGTCNTSKGNRAAPRVRGIVKYHALHRKRLIKDYKRRPSRVNTKRAERKSRK